MLTGAVISGILGGLLSGTFGVGGGVVLVPMLALALGLGQHEAQAVALAVMLLPIGLPAVIAYQRRAPIRWRLAGAICLGFLPAVALGSRVATGLPDRPLRALFTAFLLAVAWRTWRIGRAAEPTAGATRPGATAWHGLWIGALGGALAGLFGVGGAVAMIPFLVGTLGLTQLEAQGTTLAAMLPPIGLPGVLVYAQQGALPWGIMAAVAGGFLAGAFGGAELAARAGSRRLSRWFAVFVLVSAVGMAWRTLRG